MQRLQILDEAADIHAKSPSYSLSLEILNHAMPWLQGSESPSVN